MKTKGAHKRQVFEIFVIVIVANDLEIFTKLSKLSNVVNELEVKYLPLFLTINYVQFPQEIGSN